MATLLLAEVHGGKLNDANFGSRFQGEGPFAEQMQRLYEIALLRNGFQDRTSTPLSTEHFRNPEKARQPTQLELF